MLKKLSVILLALVSAFALSSAVSAAPSKVNICHIPPGNPDNFHTITISENAISAHLAHLDLAGACNELCEALCDDGDACTIDDDGDCESLGCPLPQPVNCDDGNFCTIDSCDSVTGCVYTPVDCGSEASCYADSGACVPNNCTAATYEGTEYWICQGSKTRPEAVDACTSEGMQLAFIADDGENTFVVDTALDAYPYVDFLSTSYWIANTKSGGGYLPFAAGEPSGDGDFIHILRYGNQPYGWNDVPLTYRWGWVCETVD